MIYWAASKRSLITFREGFLPVYEGFLPDFECKHSKFDE
jgi:hypothetical protein